MTPDRPSALHTALRLGRASNVPTVWTNVAAGMALSSLWLPNLLLTLLAIAVSLSYVGGMYLNDAFDAAWDARNRPDRPIPAGHVRRGTVFAAGFGMLVAGALLVAVATGVGPAFWAALVLAALILVYDAFHKANPLSPLVMAACRVTVYVLASLAVHPPPPPRALYLGAGALALYLVFLSTLARKETLHPKLPRMIGSLVAGISLLDAGILLLTGHPLAAVMAVAAFFLTRYFQRTIPGS
jgi:4-hydroxybenzoate polyprenyltransferase